MAGSIWKIKSVSTGHDVTTDSDLILSAVKHTRVRTPKTSKELISLWENLEGIKFKTEMSKHIK